METHFFSFFRIQITNYFILDHSNYWSFCPFWGCLLFQWYIATIDTWFPIWLSIYRGYLEIWSRTIGFDRNQRLLMMDKLVIGK